MENQIFTTSDLKRQKTLPYKRNVYVPLTDRKPDPKDFKELLKELGEECADKFTTGVSFDCYGTNAAGKWQKMNSVGANKKQLSTRVPVTISGLAAIILNETKPHAHLLLAEGRNLIGLGEKFFELTYTDEELHFSRRSGGVYDPETFFVNSDNKIFNSQASAERYMSEYIEKRVILKTKDDVQIMTYAATLYVLEKTLNDNYVVKQATPEDWKSSSNKDLYYHRVNAQDAAVELNDKMFKFTTKDGFEFTGMKRLFVVDLPISRTTTTRLAHLVKSEITDNIAVFHDKGKAEEFARQEQEKLPKFIKLTPGNSSFTIQNENTATYVHNGADGVKTEIEVSRYSIFAIRKALKKLSKETKKLNKDLPF